MNGRGNEDRPKSSANGRDERARELLVQHLDGCPPCSALLAFAADRVDRVALRAWGAQLAEHLETDLERRRLGMCHHGRVLAGARECLRALGAIPPPRRADAAAAVVADRDARGQGAPEPARELDPRFVDNEAR
jgi:hypothetical protein